MQIFCFTDAREKSNEFFGDFDVNTYGRRTRSDYNFFLNFLISLFNCEDRRALIFFVDM